MTTPGGCACVIFTFTPAWVGRWRAHDHSRGSLKSKLVMEGRDFPRKSDIDNMYVNIES